MSRQLAVVIRPGKLVDGKAICTVALSDTDEVLIEVPRPRANPRLDLPSVPMTAYLGRLLLVEREIDTVRVIRWWNE